MDYNLVTVKHSDWMKVKFICKWLIDRHFFLNYHFPKLVNFIFFFSRSVFKVYS